MTASVLKQDPNVIVVVSGVGPFFSFLFFSSLFFFFFSTASSPTEEQTMLSLERLPLW